MHVWSNKRSQNPAVTGLPPTFRPKRAEKGAAVPHSNINAPKLGFLSTLVCLTSKIGVMGLGEWLVRKEMRKEIVDAYKPYVELYWVRMTLKVP